MEPAKKSKKTMSRTQPLKVAISNILFFQSEKQTRGINSVFEAAMEFAPDLTNEYLENLKNILRVKMNEIKQEEEASKFSEAVEE